MKLEHIIMHYHRDGKNRCPIILLHDILSSAAIWYYVAYKLNIMMKRPIYSVDARNHGQSGWSDDFTLQFMADDVKEFMSEHKIPKAVLVGSGVGGSVAMKLALESPELVEKLVVEDMVPTPYPQYGWKTQIIAVRMWQRAMEVVPESGDASVAMMEIANYIKDNLTEMYPIQNHIYTSQLLPLRWVAGRYECKTNLEAIENALSKKDFHGDLTGKYDGEALFLFGVDSVMKVGEDEEISNLFPKAVRIAVNGAAHMTHVEMPELFEKHVVHFIQEFDSNS